MPKRKLGVRGYARHRDVSHTAVVKAINSGRITVDEYGKIDPDQADREWNENTDITKPLNSVTGNPSRARKGKKEEKGSDKKPSLAAQQYTTSRAIREAYLARLAKLEFEEKSGKLIDAEKIAEWWTRIISAAKTRVLAVPTKAAPLVLGCKTLAQVKEILEQQLYDALAELSASDPLAGVTRPESVASASEADGEPVGGQVPKVKP